jgi:predicted pyridoxine 5'-phosphate oxidase superfamily flavin-nucleotide-binding protein
MPDMGILTDTMRRAVERQRSGWVTSRAPDGARQEAEQAWLAVWDDATLAFADTGADATVRNLIESPPVEITVVDPENGTGFRFAGTSRVLLSGPTFERMRSFYSERGLHAALEHVVFVNVDRVDRVGAGVESDEAAGDGGLVRSRSDRDLDQKP